MTGEGGAADQLARLQPFRHPSEGRQRIVARPSAATRRIRGEWQPLGVASTLL
jgi:hypothetical protein